MIPGTICGGYLSQRLLAKGYSVGTTRKILETICMGTEMVCLIIIGEIPISQVGVRYVKDYVPYFV